MGYNTTVRGELRIEPPLTWGEIKDSIYNPQSEEYDEAIGLSLHIETEDIETPDGPLQKRTATHLVPYEDAFRAYNLLRDVQVAISAFPGHAFTGRLECEGEDNSDMWRVVVRDGRAVRIDPTITWPEA